jgi:hypothetical protein
VPLARGRVGAGTRHPRVVSWIVNHQPFLPGRSADAPFAVLYVHLDDGAQEGADIHMYGNLVGAAPARSLPGCRSRRFL